MNLYMEKKFCFKTKEGNEVFLYKLQNKKGTIVYISNYGGIINKFIVMDANGKPVDIVLGFDEMESYLDPMYLTKYPYFGAIIGRYANRIANAEFQIDGKQYPVSKNNKTNQLHGGWEGFDRKIWNTKTHTNEVLELEYLSRDGEEGFPGNVQVITRYELSETSAFSYEFTATSDQPTALNLSHHSYFNLEGHGNILDHELLISSDKILQQDDLRVATGIYEEIGNTGYDFTRPSIIKNIMNVSEGIDHSYLINKKEDLTTAAILTAPHSKIRLEVITTEPVVHLYTGKGIPPYKGKKNETYGDYAGLCLETQVHPNAINIPHFPETILRPGETYKQKTIYRLSIADEK